MANKLVKIMFISCLASLSGFPITAISAPSSTVAVSPTTVVVPTFVATPTPEVDKCERYANAPGCNPVGCVPASSGGVAQAAAAASISRSCMQAGEGAQATCECQCDKEHFVCGKKCCRLKATRNQKEEECVIGGSDTFCKTKYKNDCQGPNQVQCGPNGGCCDISVNECVHRGDGSFTCMPPDLQCTSPQFLCKAVNNVPGVPEAAICCDSRKVCTQQADSKGVNWPKCTDVERPCNFLAGEVDCTAIEPIIARDGVAYFAHDCCVKPEICEIRGTSANCVAPVSSRTPTAAPAAF